MKAINLTLISLVICSNFVSSQQVYESNYVFEGNTFSFELPDDYFEMEDDQPELFFFTNDVEADPDELKNGPPSNGIAMMFMEAPYGGLEGLKAVMSEGLTDGAQLLVEQFDGQDFVILSGMENFTYEDIEAEIAATLFGDYVIILMSTKPNFEEEFDTKKMLTNTLSSFKILATDKENEFFLDVYEDSYEGDYEFYDNSLFPTSLKYQDVFFEYYEEGWSESYDSDPRLLVRYDLYEGQAHVELFSGGQSSDYNELSYMLHSIEMACDLMEGASLKFEKDLIGSNFNFKKYFVEHPSDENRVKVLFTTIYNDELLFFVVKDGDERKLIESDYLPFIQSFRVYTDEEFEEDYSEEEE